MPPKPKLTWQNLVGVGEGEDVEEFLYDADIGSIIFTTDPGLIKNALLGCIAKFEKYPGIHTKCFQLLQDCHLLSPPGITNEELSGRFDAILRSISSWINKADVCLNALQFLSMVADREVMKQRSVLTEDCELLYYVNRVIALHHSSKPIQRAALQLFESIIENAPTTALFGISNRIFKSVLDNLLLNNEDNSICFSSFSILLSLADHATAIIIPWTDQLINISISTLQRQASSEVCSKCMILLEKLTKDREALFTVARHKRGLFIFIDALNTLRPSNISAAIISLEMFLKIIEDYDLALAVFQSIEEEDAMEYAKKLRESLKEKFEKFVEMAADSEHTEDDSIRYLFILHTNIDELLEEMMKPEITEEVNKTAIAETIPSTLPDERVSVSSPVSNLVPSSGVHLSETAAKNESHPSASESAVGSPAPDREANVASEELSKSEQKRRILNDSNVSSSAITVALHSPTHSVSTVATGATVTNTANTVVASAELDHLNIPVHRDNIPTNRSRSESDDSQLSQASVASGQSFATLNTQVTQPIKPVQSSNNNSKGVSPISKHSPSPIIASNALRHSNKGTPTLVGSDKAIVNLNVAPAQDMAPIPVEAAPFNPPSTNYYAPTHNPLMNNYPRGHTGKFEAPIHGIVQAIPAKESNFKKEELANAVEAEIIPEEVPAHIPFLPFRGQTPQKGSQNLDEIASPQPHFPAAPLQVGGRVINPLPPGKALFDVKFVEEMQSQLKIAQQQATKAIKKSDTMHQLFKDAAIKIESLLNENSKLCQEIERLKKELNKDSKDGVAQTDNMQLYSSTDTPGGIAPTTEELKYHFEQRASLADRDAHNTSLRGRSKSPVSRPDSSLSEGPSMFSRSPVNGGSQSKASDNPALKSVSGINRWNTPVSEFLSTQEIMQMDNTNVSGGSKKLSKKKDNLNTTVVSVKDESKRSVALLGVLEALEMVDKVHSPIRTGSKQKHFTFEDSSNAEIPPAATPAKEDGQTGDDHSADTKGTPATESSRKALQPHMAEVQMFADHVQQLFIRILETHSNFVHSPVTRDNNSNIISTRRLRYAFEGMKLIDGATFSQKKADIIFNRFRSKHITLFGAGFSIILCGRKRFPQLNNIELIRALEQLLLPYLSSDNLIDKETQPLEKEPPTTKKEFEEVLKVLEHEKKPLGLLYIAYAPWLETGEKISNVTFTMSSKETNHGAWAEDHRMTRRVCKYASERFNINLGPNHPGLSMLNVLRFTKEFQIIPEVVNRNQVIELFYAAASVDSSSVNRSEMYYSGDESDSCIDESKISTRVQVSADHHLSFTQFLDFLVLIAVRCPLFRGANSPKVKLSNFLHLLNLSRGREILSRRNRSSELVIFRPILESTATEAMSSSTEKTNSSGNVGVTSTQATAPIYDSSSNSIVQVKRKKSVNELRELIVNPSAQFY